MIFSYNWLQEFFSAKLAEPQQLGELLASHAFEVEEVTRQGKDWMLDAKILPPRPDAMSHMGLAREIGAITRTNLRPPKISALRIQKGTLAPLRVRIADPMLVPRYTAIVVEGVSVTESPLWIKERLHSLGIHSINTIVDITNLVMLELGQPLHAFDYDKIQRHEMTVRASKKGESILTLDDKTFSLPQGSIVIEDEGRIIDLAGIKGGKLSGIDERTKNIIFEAANFHGTTIYKTKKAIGYTTPAADIFAHSISPEGTRFALERAYHLLCELGGGTLVQSVDLYPKKRVSPSILFDLAAMEKLLGLRISAKEARAILERLGFQIAARKTARPDVFRVSAPAHRIDISISEDVAEEVGRIYGYERIAASFPMASIRGAEENPRVRLQEILRNLLQCAGFTESYAYSFLGEKDVERLGYTPQETERLVELANPFSEDIKYLRPSLVDTLMKGVGTNDKMAAKEDIALFEIEDVFSKPAGDAKATRMTQTRKVAGIFASKESSGQQFYHVKGAVEFLLRELNVENVAYTTYRGSEHAERNSLWKRSAASEIFIHGVYVGVVGEINEEIISNLNIARNAAAFEIDIAALLAHETQERFYVPPAKFPGAVRDISLVLPRAVTVEEVQRLIKRQGGDLLRSVELFDRFEDAKKIGEAKSLAFHLLYQSDERTLEGAEIDRVHEAISRALESNAGWNIRQ